MCAGRSQQADAANCTNTEILLSRCCGSMQEERNQEQEDLTEFGTDPSIEDGRGLQKRPTPFRGPQHDDGMQTQINQYHACRAGAFPHFLIFNALLALGCDGHVILHVHSRHRSKLGLGQKTKKSDRVKGDPGVIDAKPVSPVDNLHCAHRRRFRGLLSVDLEHHEMTSSQHRKNPMSMMGMEFTREACATIEDRQPCMSSGPRHIDTLRGVTVW